MSVSFPHLHGFSVGERAEMVTTGTPAPMPITRILAAKLQELRAGLAPSPAGG